MSLFAILYASDPSTPEAALAAAFPGHAIVAEPPFVSVATETLHATAGIPEQSPFDLEVIGIHPRIRIYFALDMSRSVEAREALGRSVKRFLESVHGDVVVTYLDTVIVKRVAAVAVCVNKYSDMIPESAMIWTVVPTIGDP